VPTLLVREKESEGPSSGVFRDLEVRADPESPGPRRESGRGARKGCVGVIVSAAADVAAPQGYRTSDVGVIPEDWDVVPLSELLAFRNGVNADKSAYGRGIRFINVLEVITKPHLRAEGVPGRVTLADAAKKAYSVQRGDVLFNRTSETQEEVGLAAVYDDDEPVVFGGFVIRGRPITSRLDPQYAGSGLRGEAVRTQIVMRGQGAIRANIGQAELRQVQVPVPPVEEQRAITAALLDADRLIESLETLIGKKKAVRHGALQALLTAATRLPGFTTAWGTSTVGAEFDLQLGKMLDAARNIGSWKPYIGNRAVQRGRMDLDAIGRVPLTASDMTRFRLEKGDLLVCGGGEIGRAAIWDAPIAECYYQKALHRLRPKGSYRPRFLMYLLQLWTTNGYLDNT
jgi:restriction endonuclease S subunit